MIKTIALLALALVLAGAHAAEFEIKGIKVDVPADCVQVKALEVRPALAIEECQPGRALSRADISFLDGTSSLFIKQTGEGIVAAVAVRRFDFDAALDALTVKFGAPSIERSTIQNRMGATFTQEVATWKQGKQVLQLTRHASKLDEPSLMLTGEAALKDAAEQRSRKATDGARNL